ncbi:MAG TPA: RecX family transcriptional regulator [Longimicrobiales bacterium]
MAARRGTFSRPRLYYLRGAFRARAACLSPGGSLIRITALSPLPGRPGRVAVSVDGVTRCTAAIEVVAAAGLHVGDAVEESALARLERADLAWRVRQAAFDLLAYRPRSLEELRRRLLRKSFPEDAVDACLADLRARGWLDDEAFAAGFVRDRIRRRPRGRRALVFELRARGVAPERAAGAVEEVFREDGVSELDLARAAAKAWRRRAGKEAARAGAACTASADARRLRDRRRLHAYLMRRGFSAAVVGEVVAEIARRSD